MDATCQIDGFGPLNIARPASVMELGDIVRQAATDGAAIYPIAGQTQLGLGNPPIKPGLAVDLRGLDAVIDFPARDDKRFLANSLIYRTADGGGRVEYLPVTITRWPPAERVYGR